MADRDVRGRAFKPAGNARRPDRDQTCSHSKAMTTVRKYLIAQGCTVVTVLCLGCSDGDTLDPSPPVEGPIRRGSDGAPVISVPGEGIWTGQLTSNTDQTTQEVVAVVDSWGLMRLLTDEGQLFGAIVKGDPLDDMTPITAELTGITAPASTWLDGSTVAEFSLDGGLIEWYAIEADYSGAGDSGTLSLSFDPNAVPGANVSGLWAQRDASQNIIGTYQISFGSLNGSESAGCVLNGTLDWSPWDSLYVFSVALTFANCPGDREILDGQYTGEGGVTNEAVDGGDGAYRFVIGVDNGEQALRLTLDKL